MSQSLISVIVPVYNVKEYLNTCVESILNQTHENLEVILVDDGSTDGSGEICDSYAKTDTRVQVLHTTNGGQAAARNRGIEVCKGEYLTFIDSDDSMEPELIETLYLAQKKSGANLVSCRWRNVYEDGRIERSSGQTNGSVTVGKEEALRRMLYQIDTEGLDRLDIAVLKAIVTNFNGGPVGLNNLAAMVGEESETVETVCEPYLVREGFLIRTPKGRVATRKAWEHLGITPDESAYDVNKMS